MRKPSKPVEHPALAFMRHEAKGYLIRFETDLTKHDTEALARRPVNAFAWILRPDSTFLAFAGPEYRGDLFARMVMVVQAFGSDGCRFYFWDCATLVEYPCAMALDERLARYEANLRIADRGNV